MKMFYRLKNQRAQGPFTLEEMIHWVRTEELAALDPVFREGEEKWRSLGDFAEFRAILREIKVKKDQESWVLLAKKDPSKRGGYNQRGPYTTEQIREMIQKGEVLYTDHVWKKGMTEWKKVSAVDDFNPPTPIWDLPPPPQIFPAPPTDVPSEELLKKVIMKPQLPLVEPKPPEAVGEDLASTKTVVAPAAPQQIHITVNQPAAPSPAPVSTPVSKKAELLPENTHVRIQITDDDDESNWWIHLIIIAVVAGLAGYYLMISSKPDRDDEDKSAIVAAKPIHDDADPLPSAALPDVPEPSPRPEPAPAPAPTQAAPPVSNIVRAPRTLRIETAGRRNGKITVKSDASPHFDLKVELTATFGEVIGKRSEIRRRTYQKITFPYELDLAGIVPSGFYMLKLELGDKTYKTRVWVNSTGKDLKPALQRYIKQNIFGFISEKRKLVRLLKKWQDAGQPDPFGEVSEFNRRNRPELYYLPQYWAEAYDLYAKPKGPQWTKAVQKLRSGVLYAHPYGITQAR